MARKAILFGVIMLHFVVQLVAQPNCRDVNLSVDEFGAANFIINDLISDVFGVAEATISFETYNGDVVFGPVTAAGDDLLSFPACDYLEDSLKARIETDAGCWSKITFKKNFGPLITGRHYNVYCFDPLIDGPQDDGPDLAFSCDPAVGEVTFVADWITEVECDPGVQDTLKVIYREWENIDKDGYRGVGFDTIIVFNLPEITADNFYCSYSDTIYCGNTSTLGGPYFTFPEIPGEPSPCDTIYLLDFSSDRDGNLQVSNEVFDNKCGIGTKVELLPFGKYDCSNIYKVTLDLKQECFGVSQTGCIVSPPAGLGTNMGEQVAPGYWRCTSWIVDNDTLPPDVHCKYPVLFSGEFAINRWVQFTQGDGSIDLSWAPYNVTLIGNDNASPDLEQNLCRTLAIDTVITFVWEYRSENTSPSFDPFGYTLNGVFYQLSDDMGGLIQNGYKMIELREGDVFCFTQLSVDGLEGRARTTIKPLTVVSTGSEECAAHAYLPRVDVRDDWSGVKAVKANITGIGTYTLFYDEDEDCYLTHETAKLNHSIDPYQIVYTAVDGCHNTATDTCYILVKDAVRPTVHLDKGLTVSVSSKKVWVPVEDFDESSTDNCGVNLRLVRRADWYESCIDICDDLDTLCVTEHEDILWKPTLEDDKLVDEAEANYFETLRWLETDGKACSEIIYNAWQYDLIKYANLLCFDHPYPVDEAYIRSLMKDCMEEVEECFLTVNLHPDPVSPDDPSNTPNLVKFDDRLLELYDQIGGGWAKDVPFDCEDACSSVTVEVLVMDYWCNWNKAWSTVWVEDKVPPVVVSDVADAEVTCKTYRSKRYDLRLKDHPVSLEEIVDLAKEDNQTAFAALDDIFGGYEKVWQGQYGYVDINGDPVEEDIEFSDSSCFCAIDDVVRTRVYDDHLGEYYYRFDTIYECGYQEEKKTFKQGQVLTNCATYVGCEQDVWCEFDHCGEGTIYRKFKIWTGCPPSFFAEEGLPDSLIQRHQPDTIERIQVIRVYNECELAPYQFDIPLDVEVEDCGLVFEDDGSTRVTGAADPDLTGHLTYRLADDCRLVGIGYDDKVFNIVGGDGLCYKIERTWYYMDWCEGEPDSKNWWKDETFEIGSFVQNIMLTDTTPPVCEINGPVENGGVIEVGSCTYSLNAELVVTDACGGSSYYWELKSKKSSGSTLLESGEGLLNSVEQESVTITTGDLDQGIYLLKVRVVDDCANESYCEYDFEIKREKKPTPICLMHLTARLTPTDSDQDGVIDTALAVIWAGEFDRSSTPACDDTGVRYRIEVLDGVDDDSPDGDPDNLEFGCQHIGTQMIRLWVISTPSGSIDFCDVILQVMSPESGCPDNSSNSEETETNVVLGEVSQNGNSGSSTGSVSSSTSTQTIPSDASFGGLMLQQNQPNPFSDLTRLQWQLAEESWVQLTIYDLSGRVIQTDRQLLAKGLHQKDVKFSDLPGPGVYIYRVETENASATQRMVAIE